jgi:hypothetical protein
MCLPIREESGDGIEVLYFDVQCISKRLMEINCQIAKEGNRSSAEDKVCGRPVLSDEAQRPCCATTPLPLNANLLVFVTPPTRAGTKWFDSDNCVLFRGC